MKKSFLASKAKTSKATFQEIEYERSKNRRLGQRDVPKIINPPRHPIHVLSTVPSKQSFRGPAIDFDIESREAEAVIAALKQFPLPKPSGKVRETSHIHNGMD